MFNFLEIQTHRTLSEQEVQQVNFVLKQRAYRYIAAPEESWLYPERVVSKSDWAEFGDGILFLPDPRPLTPTSQYTMGYTDGTSEVLDSFGRGPHDPDFDSAQLLRDEWLALRRTQAMFASRFGPVRRGRTFSSGKLDPETDSDELYEHHLAGDQ
jgi:hypothetical protein